MAVISLTITESSDYTVLGIPNTLTILSNIPSLIFFTLDGTEPDSNSPVYIHPIELPSYLKQVNINIFATDGVNNSSVISRTFTADLSSISNLASGARFPQSTMNFTGNPANGNSLFPFGTTDPSSYVNYTGIGNPDNTVYNESLPSVPNGYDENGNPASFSNSVQNPLNQTSKLENKNVTVIGKNSPVEYTQEYSSNNDKLFNPRALVIYHDASNDDPLTPKIINRAHFSLENPEIVKDGILLSTARLDSPTLTGSFVKSYYNPNTKTMKTYYRDNSVNRWIISEWQYTPTETNLDNLGGLVFGRETGSKYVYPWILWQKRTLM